MKADAKGLLQCNVKMVNFTVKGKDSGRLDKRLSETTTRINSVSMWKQHCDAEARANFLQQWKYAPNCGPTRKISEVLLIFLTNSKPVQTFRRSKVVLVRRDSKRSRWRTRSQWWKIFYGRITAGTWILCKGHTRAELSSSNALPYLYFAPKRYFDSKSDLTFWIRAYTYSEKKNQCSILQYLLVVDRLQAQSRNLTMPYIRVWVIKIFLGGESQEGETSRGN